MRKPFVMNILQTLPLCKLLNTSILRPKYPRGGRGYPQATAANEVKRIKRQQHQKKCSSACLTRVKGGTRRGYEIPDTIRFGQSDISSWWPTIHCRTSKTFAGSR